MELLWGLNESPPRVLHYNNSTTLLNRCALAFYLFLNGCYFVLSLCIYRSVYIRGTSKQLLHAGLPGLVARITQLRIKFRILR